MQALLSLLSSIMKDGLDLVDKQVPHKERQSRTSISTMRYIERVPCKIPDALFHLQHYHVGIPGGIHSQSLPRQLCFQPEL